MTKLNEENPEGVFAHICILPIQDLVDMVREQPTSELVEKFSTLEPCAECARKLVAAAGQLFGSENESKSAALLFLARELAKTTDTPDVEAQVLLQLGDLAASHNNGSAAQSAYEQAAALARSAGNTSAEAEAMSKLGSVHYSASRIEAALAAYEQALALESSMENQEAMGAALSNLGSIYFLNGDYAHAAQYQARAATVRLACGDKRGAANSLLAAARARAALQEREPALSLYAKAGELYASLNDARSQAVCAASMSAVRESLGDLRGAVASRLDALRFFRMAGARAQASSTLQTIASLYTALGDNEQAEEYRWQAEQEAR